MSENNNKNNNKNNILIYWFIYILPYSAAPLFYWSLYLFQSESYINAHIYIHSYIYICVNTHTCICLYNVCLLQVPQVMSRSHPTLHGISRPVHSCSITVALSQMLYLRCSIAQMLYHIDALIHKCPMLTPLTPPAS